MRTSEQINEIAAALAAAQAEFPPIKKGRTATVRMKAEKGGGQYQYHYADLSDIFDAVRPVLASKGLAIVQVTVNDGGAFLLTTRLMHASGQWVETDFPLTMNGTIQEVGSEQTYCRRYSLCGILGIAAEEDDDGQGANSNGDRKPQTKRTPPTQPAARQEAKATDAGAAAATGELVTDFQTFWDEAVDIRKAMHVDRQVFNNAMHKFVVAHGGDKDKVPVADLRQLLQAMTEDRFDYDNGEIRQGAASAA